MAKSWKKMWVDHFRLWFGDNAARWADCHDDDRRIFVNVYNMVMRALESLPDEPDILVKCAMNNAFHDEHDAMERIAAAFAGM